MPNINFPANPTIGQPYTFNGATWIFNGVGWSTSQPGYGSQGVAGPQGDQGPQGFQGPNGFDLATLAKYSNTAVAVLGGEQVVPWDTDDLNNTIGNIQLTYDPVLYTFTNTSGNTGVYNVNGYVSWDAAGNDGRIEYVYGVKNNQSLGSGNNNVYSLSIVRGAAYENSQIFSFTIILQNNDYFDIRIDTIAANPNFTSGTFINDPSSRIFITKVDGLLGPTGFQGPTGDPGGPQGFQGFTGFQGDTGPKGDAGNSTSIFQYKANTATQSGGPTAGRVIWNNVNQINSTTVSVSHLTSQNIDIDIILASFYVGQSIIFQDADISGSYQKWLISGTPSNFNPNTNTSYWDFPVTIITYSGTFSFTNEQDIILASIAQGLIGSQGFQGPTGSQGFTGPQGSTGGTGVKGDTGITKGSFGITLDGGTIGITTGSKGYVTMPYGGTISGWYILGNSSGNISVDLKKSTYANFPTTTSVTNGNPINLISQQKNSETNLGSWSSTTFSATDIYEFNVDSTSGLNRVNVVINTDKTS